MTRVLPSWTEYENQVYLYLTKKYPTASIKKDIKIVGRISGRERQADILIRQTIVPDISILTVVECKYYSRRIGIKTVEAFESMLRDIGAQVGLLVSNVSFSKGADQRVKESNLVLRILTDDELLDYNFPIDFCDNCLPESGGIGVIEWGSSLIHLEYDNSIFKKVGFCERCSAICIECPGCSEINCIEASEEVCFCHSCESRYLIDSSCDRDGVETIYLSCV